MANFTQQHEYTFGGKTRTATQKSGKMFSLGFSGMNNLLTAFMDLSGSATVRAIGEALRETHKLVTPNIHAEMKKHYRTGTVEASIVDTAKVDVQGNIVSMPIGFDLDNGGIPSIWLMYGTPKQAPDEALRNVIFGRQTAYAVARTQRKAIKEAMERYINGNGGNK